MDQPQAQAYLSSLLNKTLRVHTTDARLFWGTFKCTDADKNVVLANTYEYRQPSAPRLVDGPDGSTAQDGTSRYLGLVVVPGRHIARMELEEFASQVAGLGVM
ncbi:LSM domain-containing protein [Metarhizium album ARSEF 1941]|uniref:LSM domain-containing protein n=1 Tax=Metarhizium album (strain ARSEF 1941) TaxID=1081103 RepID=A0A0B2WV70_METAS|nr:LSM domain-containing protein [Metarhizium album ARSEF 1941]KHN96790.1 LSM domain-containing protein [Metarhizium album ARSEF 1941]